jgi:N6-L-threonylcarbamoyladenine synthase
MTRILGIETSCDETSASVLSGAGDDVALDSLVILSQDVHRVFGGVVPEIASRQHLTAIVPVVERALTDANVGLSDLDAIAVT